MCRKELHRKLDSVATQQRSLQLQRTEIYRTENDVSLKSMNEVFVEKYIFYILRGNDNLSGYRLWHSLSLETVE